MSLSGMKRVFSTGLADNSASDKEGVGTLRREGSKTYKYVKFTGANAVAAGDVVCYADAVDNTTVDKANAAVGAGVAVAAAASGAASYGWIQTGGIVTLGAAIAGAAPAAGNMVTTTGATAGQVTKIAAVTDCIFGVIVHVANKIIDLKCVH